MSAGGYASVTLANPGEFLSVTSSNKKIDIGYVVNLVVDENRSDGWILVCVPMFAERCWFILRRDLNAHDGTAEYACVALTDNALGIEVCQYVLIQNDSDYDGRGIDRFQVFFEHAARVSC